MPEADYVDVGELLVRDMGRDYTFLHPEVLEQKCRAEGDHLVLPNRLHRDASPSCYCPATKPSTGAALKKIRAFYLGGGCVIATGQLPFKSAEFGHDRDVQRAISSMFEDENSTMAGQMTTRRNARGGRAIRLRSLSPESLRIALDSARHDFDVSFAPGGVLRYIHKTRNGRHVFFFANLDPKLAETTVFLRGRHRLETWDPHTGAISPVDSRFSPRNRTDWTEVRLRLPYLKSVFLISSTAP